MPAHGKDIHIDSISTCIKNCDFPEPIKIGIPLVKKKAGKEEVMWVKWPFMLAQDCGMQIYIGMCLFQAKTHAYIHIYTYICRDHALKNYSYS